MKSIFLLLLFSFPLFGSMQVPDPYTWLEEMDPEKTTAWVENQNQITQDYLMQIPGREKIKKSFKSHQLCWKVNHSAFSKGIFY